MLRHSDRGQSLVEFALVLPLLLLVLMGIFEFGRIWMTINVITSAAREGARVAAVTAPDVAAARAAANNVLNGGHVTGATVTVSGPSGANEVQVTIAVNYQPMVVGLIPGLHAMTLNRSATMHWEH